MLVSPTHPAVTRRPSALASACSCALTEPRLLAIVRYRGLPLRCLLLRASDKPRTARRPDLTLGASARAHAPADLGWFGEGDDARQDWKLVEADGGGFRLSLPAQAALWWRAGAACDADAIDVGQLPRVLRLDDEGALTVVLGDVSVELSRASAMGTARLARARFGAVDEPTLLSHAVSGLLVLAWLLVFRAMPPDAKALSFDLGANVLRRPPWVRIPPVLPVGGPPGASMPASQGSSGAADAAPTSTPSRGHRPREGAPAPAAKAPSAEDAVEKIRQAGILGLLPHTRAGWDELVGGNALGDDAEATLRDLAGSPGGDALAAGGFGPPGTGTGPAGTGEGLRGGGPAFGIPGGVGDAGHPRTLAKIPLLWAKKLTHALEVVPCGVGSECHVQGSLDKEIIRRTIRRHMNEVRYCYQESLQRRPSLEGRIVLSFLILPQGTTTAVAPANDTVGDPGLASCLVQAARRWEYPQPQGGGVVKVTFPFNFVRAGDGF